MTEAAKALAVILPGEDGPVYLTDTGAYEVVDPDRIACGFCLTTLADVPPLPVGHVAYVYCKACSKPMILRHWPDDPDEVDRFIRDPQLWKEVGSGSSPGSEAAP